MKYSNMRKAAININTFIKTFVGSGVREVIDAANDHAKKEKLEIVSAQLAFSGSGSRFEEPVLVVVYDSEKPKRARKKADGKDKESDE